MEKPLYLSPYSIQRDSYLLARQIIDSGFMPDFLCGLWRGGADIAVHVHELMDYQGIKVDHFPIKTSRYEGSQEKDKISVWGLEYLRGKTTKQSSILFVDDVFDKGITMEATIDAMNELHGENAPGIVKIATLYSKPSQNKTSLHPDFCIFEVGDRWIFFSYELKELDTEQKLCDAKGKEIAEIILGRKL